MDYWRERKYVDLWSINHFLSGAVFAGWIFEFGWSGTAMFALYVLLNIVWETFEIVIGVGEYMSNRVVDVIVGILGFILISIALDESGVIHDNTLLAVTFLFLIMNLLGFLAYRKRKGRS